MSSTRAQLEALLLQKVTSGGGDTTAADVRDIIDALIISCLNKNDDLNVADGYIGADLAQAYIYIGGASGVAAAKSLSGDATIDKDGVLTVTSIKPLFKSVTTVGNATTTETTLVDNQIVGGTLVNDLDELFFEYGGNFVNSGTSTREIKLYFGAGNLILDSGALTIGSNSSWIVRGSLIRKSNTISRYVISFQSQASITSIASVGELTGIDFSTNLDLKLTGQASGVGTADNDITLLLSQVNFIKKP